MLSLTLSLSAVVSCRRVLDLLLLELDEFLNWNDDVLEGNWNIGYVWKLGLWYFWGASKQNQRCSFTSKMFPRGVRKKLGGSPPIFHVSFVSFFLHCFLENYATEPPITQERGIENEPHVFGNCLLSLVNICSWTNVRFGSKIMRYLVYTFTVFLEASPHFEFLLYSPCASSQKKSWRSGRV